MNTMHHIKYQMWTWKLFASSPLVRSKGKKKMNTKFMQTLEKDVYIDLSDLARERGVTIQEFLRAVVVPDWMMSDGRHHKHAKSRTR